MAARLVCKIMMLTMVGLCNGVPRKSGEVGAGQSDHGMSRLILLCIAVLIICQWAILGVSYYVLFWNQQGCGCGKGAFPLITSFSLPTLDQIIPRFRGLPHIRGLQTWALAQSGGHTCLKSEVSYKSHLGSERWNRCLEICGYITCCKWVKLFVSSWHVTFGVTYDLF